MTCHACLARIQSTQGTNLSQPMCIKLNRATYFVFRDFNVQQLYWIAQQDKNDFNFACIGMDFEHPQQGMFDTAYMKSLYDYAYQLASSGHAWHKSPPSVDPSQQ